MVVRLKDLELPGLNTLSSPLNLYVKRMCYVYAWTGMRMMNVLKYIVLLRDKHSWGEQFMHMDTYT